MKRLLTIVLALALLAGFASCSRGEDKGRITFEYTLEDTSTSKPAEDVTSGTSQKATEPSTTEASTEASTEPTSEPVTESASQPSSEAETTTETTTETTVPADTTQITQTSEAPSAAYVGPVKNGSVSYKNGLYYINDDSTGESFIIVNKTYTVPESYGPGGLTRDCSSAFSKLVSAASADGVRIWNLSGYRSYSTQQRLYNNYVARDGKSAADKYSARPGHSEHQTGLAIDCNSLSTSWANTEEGKWLAAHCSEYGFIIRYGASKISSTGYQYEPWHIRYIGSPELAKKLTDSGLSVEEYYGITSKY